MKMVKLSMSQAAVEFGVSRPTLGSKLRAAGHDTTKGGQWTLKQVHEALCGIGDRASIKYRIEAAEAEMAELELAKARRDVVDVAEASDMMDRILLPFRTRLMALPATLGQAANPADPIFGRAAVAAAVDSILPLLRDDVVKAFAAGPLEGDTDEDGEEGEE